MATRTARRLCRGPSVSMYLTGGPCRNWRLTRKSPGQEGICAMRSNHLRVYYGPQEESATVHVADGKVRDTINVPLMEVLPLLADAVRSDRTWLRDFADDEVNISMDLYEVLLAYQHYRRPSA